MGDPRSMTEKRESLNGYGYPEVVEEGSDLSAAPGKRDTRPESMRSCRGCVKHNLFIILLVIGIAAGIGMGLGIRYNHPEFRENSKNLTYLEFPGKLMLNMLKVCIIPLVTFSLIHAVGSLAPQTAGKLGGYAVLYYMITTLMAVLLGMLLVATIQPGYRVNRDDLEDNSKGKLADGLDSFLDLVRNALPPNIIEACVKTTRTDFTTESEEVTRVFKNNTVTKNYTAEAKRITGIKVGMVDGTNTLGIIVFACVFGTVLARLGEAGAPLLNIFGILQNVIIGMVKIIIWYTPFGIIFLVAQKIVSMEDLEAEFSALGWYIMTVLVGLGIHAFVILPIIYVSFTRKNPFRLLVNMGQALLTALGTASSSATMPVTLKCLEENAGVNPKVSEFMIPLGATINMDGTALYEAVASIYIAQSLGMELGAAQYVIISVTATAAAIGAAGIPEAGLVTMLIVLQAIGIEDPDAEVGLIYAVDWFLDRCRTSINVWGDSIGAGVVEKLTKSEMDKEELDMDDVRSHLQNFDEEQAFDNQGYRNPAYAHDDNIVRL